MLSRLDDRNFLYEQGDCKSKNIIDKHNITEKRSVEKKKKNPVKSLKLKLLCFVSVEEPSSVTGETFW